MFRLLSGSTFVLLHQHHQQCHTARGSRKGSATRTLETWEFQNGNLVEGCLTKPVSHGFLGLAAYLYGIQKGPGALES